MCKTPLCETRGIKDYGMLCFRCCSITSPELLKRRECRTREQAIVDFLKETMSDLNWVTNKSFGACSARRPDMIIDFITHVVIVEVDENQHASYDTTCENRRLMELSEDVAHRPMVVIRFNPDGFTTSSGVKVKSPWKMDATGISTICNFVEWCLRCDALKGRMDFWKHNVSEKTVEIEYLFYNGTFREIKPSVAAPSRLCEHMRNKYSCSECKNPEYWCEHDKRRAYCSICKAPPVENKSSVAATNRLCEHMKDKYSCSECKNPAYWLSLIHI